MNGNERLALGDNMIGIIDYGMGNTGSILNMLGRIGAESFIATKASALRQASKIILPGVGSFDNAVTRLRASGFWDALHEEVLGRNKPVLGICLGMQLLTRGSEEGDLPGLGWIPANTLRFKLGGPDQPARKVPHMGWNEIKVLRSGGILQEPEAGTLSRFYFVHSFHVVCDEEEHVLATADYGYPFHAAIGTPGIIGVQFHPEKSHTFGMRLMARFAEMNP